MQRRFERYTRGGPVGCEMFNNKIRRKIHMRLKQKIGEAGAMGYILLWLLGIPVPILLLIFLLRGCS